MHELRHFKAVDLVPVVELEPGRFATRQRESPTRPGAETPDEWDRYWSVCLADAGVVGLEPLRPGSWHVPTRRLTDPAALERIVRAFADAGDGPDALLEPESDPVLSGGFALIAGVEVLLEPMCCSDLGNLDDWREAAAYRGPDWRVLWIGHPWVSVRSDGDWLVLSEPHESHGPIARYAVYPDGLTRAIAAAEAELERFVRRLKAAVTPLVGVDRSARLARQLAGLADGHAGG